MGKIVICEKCGAMVKVLIDLPAKTVVLNAAVKL